MLGLGLVWVWIPSLLGNNPDSAFYTVLCYAILYIRRMCAYCGLTYRVSDPLLVFWKVLRIR